MNEVEILRRERDVARAECYVLREEAADLKAAARALVDSWGFEADEYTEEEIALEELIA